MDLAEPGKANGIVALSEKKTWTTIESFPVALDLYWIYLIQISLRNRSVTRYGMIRKQLSNCKD